MAGKNLKLLVTLFKTEGLGAVVNRLAFRFLRVHSFIVLRWRLSNAMAVGHTPPGVELREVSKHELEELRKGRTDLPEYFFRDQSGTEGRCWVGLQAGRLGFVAWITYTDSSGLVHIGEHEAEAAFAYCLKELRGKHMTTNAFLLIGRTLFEEGITAMYATPHSRNPAIIKSLTACGFARIGVIRRFGFVTWPRTPVDYSKTAQPGIDADVSLRR